MTGPFISERRPRVLHIITGLETGGAEMMLRKLVTRARRCQHFVVSLRGIGPVGADLREAGISVEPLQLRRASAASAIWQLISVLRGVRPDIIQGWMSHGNFVAAITRRLASPRTPLVWNIRQSICDRRYEKRGTRLVIGLNGQISSAPQQIIYNSVTGAEQHEAIGYNRSKRRIIPNGFDTEEFTPQESIRAAGRHELCVSDEEILVGVIARFHPVKNHAALFDAMARLCERTPRLRLLAVGHGMTADNSELQALIPESIRGRCLLLGRRSDIPKLTAALDIACNISVSEGFPNAIGEAMACAVPCVVTPTGDSPSIVGETGLVCKSASAADITDALDEMLSMSVDARRRLGCAARARVEEKYSLEAVVQQYEDLYEEVLESRVTGVSGATGDFCPKARNKDFGRSAIEPMKKTSIKEE